MNKSFNALEFVYYVFIYASVARAREFIMVVVKKEPKEKAEMVLIDKIKV